MGLIQRQALKHTVIVYTSIAIGAVASLFIYPPVIDDYGFIQLILNAAILAVGFSVLGLPNIAVKFFPDFSNSKERINIFFSFLLSFLTGGVFLAFFLLFVFEDTVSGFFFENGKNLNTQYYYILPLLLVFLSVNSILIAFCSNFGRIVVPNLLENFLVKLLLPLIFLGQIYGWYDFSVTIHLFLGMYVLSSLSILIYTVKLGNLKLVSFFWKIEWIKIKNILFFGFMSVLSSVGATLILRIDVLMVGSMLGDIKVGIYAISVYIADIIYKPLVGMASISTPLISSAIQDNDYKTVDNIYKKVSIHSFIIGVFLFMLLWFSLDDIYDLSAKGSLLGSGKYVILVVAIIKLISMLTSMNGHIFMFTPSFKYHTLLTFIVSSLNIGMNLFLIPEYGLFGAAMATLISSTIFESIKTVFVYLKYDTHPFTFGMLVPVVLFAILYFVINFIPSTPYSILNIFLNSLVVITVYLGSIYKLNVSSEINNMIDGSIQKVLKFIS